MILSLMLLASTACVPLPSCVDNGNVSPCASPTPTLKWDAVPDLDIAGYDLYQRDPGGPFVLVQRIACEWLDLDEDGTPETRFCKGVDFDLAIQKVCPACAPNTEHEFAVLAYDTAGNTSAAYSNIVSICLSPIWTSGPYN